MTELTYADLDMMQVLADGQVILGCTQHPGSGVTAVYYDGKVRLICRACGFEVGGIKVEK
jgi:hypothetical protein